MLPPVCGSGRMTRVGVFVRAGGEDIGNTDFQGLWKISFAHIHLENEQTSFGTCRIRSSVVVVWNYIDFKCFLSIHYKMAKAHTESKG